MSNKFFITGLPRSRTAWLAQFLTFEPHMRCVHEPTRELADYPRWFRTQLQSVDVAGISDSQLVFHYGALLMMWPQAKIVVVQRDPLEVVASLKRVRLRNPILNTTDRLLDDAVRTGFWACKALRREAAVRSNILTVDFPTLNDPQVASTVWRHVAPPDLEFDEARFVELNQRNIQANYLR